MIGIFFGNPFKDILPGGTPSQPFSKPPQVKIGAGYYLVLMLWDIATIKSRMGNGDAWAKFKADGVTAQAKVRQTDGTEYYARVIKDSQVELTMTGFRGPPWEADYTKFIQEDDGDDETKTQQEIDMTILHAFHELIKDRYAQTEGVEEEVQELCDGVADDLGACHTLAETKVYLGWPEHDWVELVEDFFKRDVIGYTNDGE